MLDARIASALNKIIQNSYFKKKVSLDKQKAQKEYRFLRGRHIAYLIYDCFRVTGAHDTVLDYAGSFSITLRDDDVSRLRYEMGVEMVEPVDDLKSSRSVRGTHGPDFEVFDARIASAQNRIIHNTRFKKKVSLEEQKAQKEDRFLRGRQIAYPIYGYFRVTGANGSVENYADLFTVVLRNDDIQEFDSKWDDFL